MGRKLTIRREFFLTGIAFLSLLSLVFILFFSSGIYRGGMETARQRLSGENRQIASYVDAHFEGLAALVRIMAANPVVTAAGTEDAASRDLALSFFHFVEDSNPNARYCYAGYADGTLLINDYEAPEGYDARIRPWYRAATAAYPDLSIGLPYQEAKEPDEWLIAVSMAFPSESGIEGVVSVDSTIPSVTGLLNRTKSYQTQMNFILDEDTVVRIHQNTSYIGKGFGELTGTEWPAPGKSSGFVSYALEGRLRLAYFTRLGVADWLLVSAVDMEELLAPLRIKILLTVLEVLGLALVLGFLQFRLYESRFVRPLVSLRQRVEAITSGNRLQALKCDFSNPEMAELAKGIEDMTEDSLNLKAYELTLILESTSDGILVLDPGGAVIQHNRRFLELWGLDTERRYGTVGGELAAKLREAAMPEYAHKIMLQESGAPALLYLTNGSILEQSSNTLPEEKGLTGKLWSFRDVTDKIQAEEHLKHIAATDELTGLWNRRYFIGRAEYELRQAAQSGRPLSLILLDVDYFKAINDQYGHVAGDRALQFLAQSLTGQLRSTDIIGRFGGEEFTILLPHADVAAAYGIGEKVRRYFRENTFVFEETRIGFTVSMGIATTASGTERVDELLKRADLACYAAKEAGRDRVLPVPEEQGTLF